MKRRSRMTILWWIIGLASAVAALKLVIVWAEPYISFVPRRGSTPPPPGFRPLDIKAADGSRLHGWRTEISTEGPVFLYFCGNAGNLSDRDDLMTRAAANGLAVIAFDYRGTGESEGRATERTVHSDAEEIYNHALGTLGVDSKRLVLWGHSIGGAVATELAREHKCAGIVLEGTFRSAVVMAKRLLPFLPVAWFMTYKFDNEANIRELRCPIFFIHGFQDFTTPHSDSEFLYKLAAEPKELWIVDDADHNDVYEAAPDTFFPRLVQFGQRVVGRQVPAN